MNVTTVGNTTIRSMMVPPAIRECVCFAYIDSELGLRPVGTAFFLGIPMGDTGRFGCLVVTAMHVVAKAREHARDCRIHLRVNTVSGGFAFVKMVDQGYSRSIR